MIKIQIDCSCGNKEGENLGVISSNKIDYTLIKCTKCKQQSQQEKSKVIKID